MVSAAGSGTGRGAALPPSAFRPLPPACAFVRQPSGRRRLLPPSHHPVSPEPPPSPVSPALRPTTTKTTMATPLDQLYALFGASFDPNPNNRKAAELELRSLEKQEGILPAAFHIVTNNDAELGHRQAAAIWVKNRTRRGWDITPQAALPPSATGGTGAPISDADKQALKQAVLPSLATLPPRLRVHAMSTLQPMIPDEFPNGWPELLPNIKQALSSGDPVTVAAGARALLVVALRLRWVSNESTLDGLVSETFPQLLQLARGLLDAPDSASNQDVGDLLHIIIKTYFRVIQHFLVPQLQESIASWGAVLLATIGKQLDESSLSEDADEKAAAPWWKAKKWAYRVLNKLYKRYGCPSQLLSNQKQYKPFAASFSAQFAPEILRAFMRQTELNVQGQYLSPVCKYSIFQFYIECIMAKGLWSLIKPHFLTLVQTFAFPALCLGQEDVEKFEDEPIAFSRERMDPIEEHSTPSSIAFEFVRVAVSKRKSSTFHPVLEFLQEVMTAAATGQRSPIEKEGALRLSGAMCVTMVNDDAVGSQLDNFMSSQVVPELGNNSQPLLQFRAAEVVKSFDKAGMEWTNTSTLESAFQGVLTCFMDVNMALPVRLQAAEALGELITHEDVHKVCAPNAGRLMQELLTLSDKTDVDILLQTQEKVVDNFSTELLPFAVDLATQLRDSFIRLVTEVVAAGQAIEEAGDMSVASAPEAESQLFAAMASLSTMYQLVSAADNNKAILAQLEAVLLPAVIFALENKQTDFMDELSELVEILTFNQQVVSPTMWRVFELFTEGLLDWAADYISELQTPLSNFVTFGAATVASNPAYKKALLDIYTSQWHPDSEDSDLIEVCRLADTMLLRLPGALDSDLGTFLEPVVGRVLDAQLDSPSLRRWTDIILLDTIIYNAPLSVQLLSSQNVLGPVLQSILPRVPVKFARMHECRVGVFSFLALLGLPAETMPAEVQAAAPVLFNGVISLLAKYPQVISNKKKFTELLDEADVEDFLDDGDDDLVEDFADDKDVKNEANDLYEILIADAQKRREKEARRAAVAAGEAVPELPEDDSDDEEDDADDDAIYESALENVRMYDAFRSWFTGFQSATPSAWETLLSQLTPEVRTSLGTVSEMNDDEIAALAEAEPPTPAAAVADKSA